MSEGVEERALIVGPDFAPSLGSAVRRESLRGRRLATLVTLVLLAAFIGAVIGLQSPGIAIAIVALLLAPAVLRLIVYPRVVVSATRRAYPIGARLSSTTIAAGLSRSGPEGDGFLAWATIARAEPLGRFMRLRLASGGFVWVPRELLPPLEEVRALLDSAWEQRSPSAPARTELRLPRPSAPVLIQREIVVTAADARTIARDGVVTAATTPRLLLVQGIPLLVLVVLIGAAVGYLLADGGGWEAAAPLVLIGVIVIAVAVFAVLRTLRRALRRILAPGGHRIEATDEGLRLVYPQIEVGLPWPRVRSIRRIRSIVLLLRRDGAAHVVAGALLSDGDLRTLRVRIAAAAAAPR